MREIKFRAWNQTERKMHEGTDFCLYANGEIGGYVLQGRLKESFIVMQFTGLHDKNGKEIYEGDIVIKDYLNRHPNDKELKPRRVKWDTQGCGFNISDPKFRKKHPYTYEVIGNIYEAKL